MASGVAADNGPTGYLAGMSENKSGTACKRLLYPLGYEGCLLFSIGYDELWRFPLTMKQTFFCNRSASCRCRRISL